MEPEVGVRHGSKRKRGPLAVILLCFAAVMLISAAMFSYLTLRHDKIYKGVYIDDFDVSGMAPQEAKLFLDNMRLPSDSREIILKAGDEEARASFSELGVKYDTGKAVESAYMVGRNGSMARRLYDIARAGIYGIHLPLPQTYDQGKVEELVNRIYLKTFSEVREGSLHVAADSLVIRSGRRGTHIDSQKTAALVKEMIKKHEGGTLDIEVIVTKPAKKFEADEIYDQISAEPANAYFKMEDSGLVLVPHIVGRKIDKQLLAGVIRELENTENIERVLPVETIMPEITSESASSMLFRDVLAAASTSFSTSTENGRNRKHNMGLALEKINNLVLMPGEEFSFNKAVGPRNAEHGYKLAHVYSGGKIIEGVGGGICQVSTTLYNAVLKADLEVVERRNHSFIVTYAPLGQDATAFYGGTDFRFKNSTRWPIKLQAEIKGNTISFALLGTNETPGKEVIISNKILKETPYQTVQIEDATLPAGTTLIKQEGLNGYVVETYKIIKVDGKVVSQSKLHTSKYNPCTEEVLVGIKPVEENPVSGTQDSPKNSPGSGSPGNDGDAEEGARIVTPGGIDDADGNNVGEDNNVPGGNDTDGSDAGTGTGVNGGGNAGGNGGSGETGVNNVSGSGSNPGSVSNDLDNTGNIPDATDQ